MKGTVSDSRKLKVQLSLWATSVHYYYPVQISGFWEQLGRNRNRIVKNSRISGHPEPDIQYIPTEVHCADASVSTVVCARYRDLFLDPIRSLDAPLHCYNGGVKAGRRSWLLQ